MNLYILRHGAAVEHGTPGYENDADRPLTSEGEKKTKQSAKGLKAMGVAPDLIISSPLPRASRTAELAASKLHLSNPVKLSKNLQPEGSPEALILELRAECAAAEEIMLVGHEPYLSSLISVLLTGGMGLRLRLRKGGLCKLRIETLEYTRCAELEWFLTPQQMIEMA